MHRIVGFLVVATSKLCGGTCTVTLCSSYDCRTCYRVARTNVQSQVDVEARGSDLLGGAPHFHRSVAEQALGHLGALPLPTLWAKFARLCANEGVHLERLCHLAATTPSRRTVQLAQALGPPLYSSLSPCVSGMRAVAGAKQPQEKR